MRKNIVLIALIVFMFVFSLQAIQPAAAAKLKVVDKGHYTVKEPYFGSYTFSWKTYQYKTSYVKMNTYMKSKGHKTQTMTITLRKESKHVLQIRYFENSRWMYTAYMPEKLTAAQYYWRVLRPEFATA